MFITFVLLFLMHNLHLVCITFLLIAVSFLLTIFPLLCFYITTLLFVQYNYYIHNIFIFNCFIFQLSTALSFYSKPHYLFLVFSTSSKVIKSNDKENSFTIYFGWTSHLYTGSKKNIPLHKVE